MIRSFLQRLVCPPAPEKKPARVSKDQAREGEVLGRIARHRALLNEPRHHDAVRYIGPTSMMGAWTKESMREGSGACLETRGGSLVGEDQ